MIIFDEIIPQLTPDVQIETDWTGQLSGLPSTTKKTLLVGHKITAGSQANGTVAQIYSVNHAIELWGKGSDVAVMAEAFFKNSPQSPLYGVSYAEGGAAVAATGTITLTTSATGSGTLQVWIAGRRFQVGVAKDDTPTVVGEALEAVINAHPNLPVTAESTTGTVALTHRTKGPHGNTVHLRCTITAGIGMTAVASGATLTAGATEGDPTTTLAGVEGDRYHLIVLHTYDDDVTLGVLSAHVEKQSAVSAQKWGIGIVGHNGTGTEAQTLAAADDSYRTQIVHHASGDQPCYELAAAFAGARARKAPNLSLDYLALKGITAQHDETAWPTSAEIEADIEGGVTPVKPLRSGEAQVVRSVVTRQTAPIAFRDHQVAEISDYTDEFIITVFRARMLGRPLKSGSPPASPTTVTPSRATALLNECLMRLDNMDYLQGVVLSIEAGHNKAEINAVDPNRVDCQFDYWPVATAHFFAMKKSYITAL